MEGEFVKAIVESTVGRMVDGLVAPIKKRLGYFFFYRKHVTNMENKIQGLESNKIDVEKRIETNQRTSKAIPTIMPSWLESVRNIKAKVETVPTDVKGCFNVKPRYAAGRKACKCIEEIDRLLEVHSKTDWTELPIPPGRVNSQKASTSALSGGIFRGFESRMSTFNDVLEALSKDDDFRVIGLWGIGGVGKTTMLKELKKTAKEDCLFDWVVSATIGQEAKINEVQEVIAGYLGMKLEGNNVDLRADRLSRGFEAISQKGSKRILVTLDDVWEPLELESIGISRSADKSAGIKILMTSRIEDVFAGMGVGDNYATFQMQIMPQHEAWMLLQTKTNISIATDHELYKISKEIVKECDCLPLAIDVISKNLKNSRKYIWEDVLRRLRNTELKESVFRALQVSFEFLKSDDMRGIFRICCLYREDALIPVEDLVKCVIGLRIFNGIDRMSMHDIRNHAKTCLEELRSACFLLYCESSESITMHDLVREFGQNLHPYCNNEPVAAIVNHAEITEWPEKESYESFASISVNCYKLPCLLHPLMCPNLTYLKLASHSLHSKTFAFPEDFYGGMEKLRVITYENLRYPLLPTSLPLCSNLRALSFSGCILMDDISIIGSLQNLEVLSFAGCGIKRLPSSIGRLVKLKLLDISGFGYRFTIDDGVLGDLIRLEELYLRKYLKITVSTCEELEKRCRTLTALEIQFYEMDAPLKAMHFKNLKRFRISLGCSLNEREGLFRNTLELGTDKNEVLGCGINGLFQATEILHLRVQGMNHVGDISAANDFSNLKLLKVERCKELVHLVNATSGKPCNVFPVTESLFLFELDNFEGIYLGSPQHPMFQNLRALEVSRCAKLKYVLSRALATGLRVLERLTVSDCGSMEEIVHDDDEIIEAEAIMFPMLRFLSLKKLPKLVGFSKSKSAGAAAMVFPQLMELDLFEIPKVTSIYGGDAVTSSASLEQSFFRSTAEIPMMEILKIVKMESLREIWQPSQYHYSKDICSLKKMNVSECDKLVNLFPTNMIPQLHHLEELVVKCCSSLKVIFDMNLEGIESNNVHYSDENGQVRNAFSSLKQISVSEADDLRHVWRIKGANNTGDHIIQGFEALKSIRINYCDDFRHLFSPSNANFDLRGLEDMEINRCSYLGGSNDGSSSSSQEVLSDEETMVPANNAAAGVFLSSHLTHTFQSLQSLCLDQCEMVKVVFDMASDQQLILPHLTQLKLRFMRGLIRVWDWKQSPSLALVPIPQPLPQFNNLTSIHLEYCSSIKYLFSPSMAKLLVNLHTVKVHECPRMEEIVSNRDDGVESGQETSTALFPHLDTLWLHELHHLERIGGGGRGTYAINTNATDELDAQVAVASWSLCQFPTEIYIYRCHALSSAFPHDAVGQLKKLQHLRISVCPSMTEVFDAKGSDGIVTIPMLKVMILDCVSKLTHLHKNGVVRFPNLTKLRIYECDSLGHIFSYSMVESLKQLKELEIKECEAVQAIVKQEDDEHTIPTCKVLSFPNLQCLTLKWLKNLKAFSLGMRDFHWPMLDKVEIVDCPEMEVFTYGHSTTPKLKYIYSGLGKHSLEGGLNFDRTTASHETQFQRSEGPSSCSTPEGVKQLRFPWSLSNLVEKDVRYNRYLVNIFPSKESLQLQKLERLHVEFCHSIVEVFEVVEGTNNETPSSVAFPELREVTLLQLHGMRHIWKSNPCTVLEFPKLTRLSIKQCGNLEHVFTSSMVGSLVQLQELRISLCDKMQVIVENGAETRVKEFAFPSLKSLKLVGLPELEAFCLGKEAFKWPSLEKLVIKRCRKLKTFTSGHSSTPELKVIKATTFALCRPKEDINSFLKTKIQEGFLL